MFRNRYEESEEFDPNDYSVGILRAEIKISQNLHLNWLFDEIEIQFEDLAENQGQNRHGIAIGLSSYFERLANEPDKNLQEVGLLGLKLLQLHYPKIAVKI